MLKKVKTHCRNQSTTIRTCFITTLLLICFTGFGQENTDLQYRLIPTVEYRFHKHWKVSAQYRYALHKDLQEFKSSTVQGMIKYYFNKKFSLETGYRFTTSHIEDSHRILSAFQFNQEMNDFTLSLTTKYQFTTGSFDSDYMNVFDKPNHYFREDIQVEYNIPKSKLNLFLGSEFFLKLSDTKEEVNLKRIRTSFGGDYQLKYGNTIGLSAFYDDKMDRRKSDRIVLITSYKFSIDDFIKKIEKEKAKKTEAGSTTIKP